MECNQQAQLASKNKLGQRRTGHAATPSDGPPATVASSWPSIEEPEAKSGKKSEKEQEEEEVEEEEGGRDTWTAAAPGRGGSS